jgi:hypothetical protein
MAKKYFIDAEFLEGKKPVKFLGITRKEINTIDLISIAIVCEDGREFYAINKECDIDHIWKDEWIRENILLPVYRDLLSKESNYGRFHHWEIMQFNLKGMKNLLNWHGWSRADIANGICAFIYGDDCGGSGMSAIEMAMKYEINDKSLEPEFYGYYSAYDWVLFCWIFGKMLTLPKGFPAYCKDLKHMLDDYADKQQWYYGRDVWSNTRELGDMRLQAGDRLATLEEKLDKIKNIPGFPKKTEEHHALPDARWNMALFNFLQTLNKITK